MKPIIIIALCLLTACGRGVPDDTRVVVAGDSILAWNRSTDGAVADGLQMRLREPVGDVSFPGAKILGGFGPLDIPAQLDGVSVQTVVLNGGANDVLGLCDSPDVAGVLDQLISDDGTQGAIPALVTDIRSRGSRVVWVDYYTAPRYAGTACDPVFDVLETRAGRMADGDAGVTLVDLDDVFTFTDPSLFASDDVHPSAKGSALIADLITPTVAR